SSGALVQPASAATLVLGDMRCNSHLSQFLDELPLVVSFIGSQRDSPAAWQLFRHQQPGMRLGRTVGRGHPRVSPPVRSDSPPSGVRGSSTSLPFLVPCGPAWLPDRWWNRASDCATILALHARPFPEWGHTPPSFAAGIRHLSRDAPDTAALKRCASYHSPYQQFPEQAPD